MYNKEVQTANFDDDVHQPTLAELRQQLSKEYEEAQQIQREKDLEEEAAKLDREIEEEIRGWFAHEPSWKYLLTTHIRTNRRRTS